MNFTWWLIKLFIKNLCEGLLALACLPFYPFIVLAIKVLELHEQFKKEHVK